MRVQFVEVVNDSRCPLNATCIAADPVTSASGPWTARPSSVRPESDSSVIRTCIAPGSRPASDDCSSSYTLNTAEQYPTSSPVAVPVL